jgi:hypothetical protein
MNLLCNVWVADSNSVKHLQFNSSIYQFLSFGSISLNFFDFFVLFLNPKILMSIVLVYSLSICEFFEFPLLLVHSLLFNLDFFGSLAFFSNDCILEFISQIWSTPTWFLHCWSLFNLWFPIQCPWFLIFVRIWSLIPICSSIQQKHSKATILNSNAI